MYIFLILAGIFVFVIFMASYAIIMHNLIKTSKRLVEVHAELERVKEENRNLEKVEEINEALYELIDFMIEFHSYSVNPSDESRREMRLKADSFEKTVLKLISNS